MRSVIYYFSSLLEDGTKKTDDSTTVTDNGIWGMSTVSNNECMLTYGNNFEEMKDISTLTESAVHDATNMAQIEKTKNVCDTVQVRDSSIQSNVKIPSQHLFCLPVSTEEGKKSMQIPFLTLRKT